MTDLTASVSVAETFQVERVLSWSPRKGAIFWGYDVAGNKKKVKAGRTAIDRCPVKGEWWSAEGPLEEHPVHGEQIIAARCRLLLPEGKLLVRYLAHHPDFKGIGPVTADMVYRHFVNEPGDGTDRGLIYILNNGFVERLKEVLPEPLALRLVDGWKRNRLEARVVVFLDQCGFKTRLAYRLIRLWGEDTVEIIHRNPYVMLIVAGWETVDRIALDMGFDQLSKERMLASAIAVLKSRLNAKHTLTSHEELLKGICRLLDVTRPVAEQAIGMALNVAITGDVVKGYQTRPIAAMESLVKQRIGRMMQLSADATDEAPELNARPQRSPWQAIIDDSYCIMEEIRRYEKSAGFGLSDEQKEAVTMAVVEGLTVLLGGAGTGKTCVLQVVHNIVEAKGGTIYQMALSGRAAKRMRQATDRHAFTIAKFLILVKTGQLDLGQEPMIIIDECSMLDLTTMHEILRHLPDGARLLLVGDPYQLPPIGFGLVFHKLADADIPCKVELTQVFRSLASTGIPDFALSVRKHIVPELLSHKGKMPGVSFIECGADEICEKAYATYAALGGFPETQVICIGNRNVAGVQPINRYFQFEAQKALAGIEMEEDSFAVGDPVIHLENDYLNELYNGSLGIIREITEQDGEMALVIEFEDRDDPFVLRQSELGRIALAYGITCHKAQGSAFIRVIVPVYRSPRLLDVLMLYTALTRAKVQVVFIGDKEAFQEAVEAMAKVHQREVGLEFSGWF